MVDFPQDLKDAAEFSARKAFPVSVTPPSRTRIVFDYIMADGTLMPETRKETLSMDSINRIHKQFYSVDYISAEDLEKLEKAKRDYVKVRAKELWDESKDLRKKVAKAKKILAAADPEDLDNPDDALQQHMQIVDTAQVPTKEDCIANARAEYIQKFGNA